MSRIILPLLCTALILTGCTSSASKQTGEQSQSSPQSTSGAEQSESTASASAAADSLQADNDQSVSFKGLDDPDLLSYVRNKIYAQLVDELNSESYFVENIDAVYVSQEYTEELAYNSQSNIYFGYTLKDLNEQFEGQRYIFTLGDNGETEVRKMDTFYDDTTEQVIKNVAVGGGVILLCVTVSVVSGGTAPAISMIFAAGAKTGTAFALSSGAISGASAAIVTGYQTQDLEQAMKAGTLAASEGFKWGAISGALSGGGKEALALHGATLHGLTMNQAASIQKESGYPLDMIKEFHNMDEYKVFKDAGLKPTMINGRSALIRDIDPKQVDEMGRTNLERMQQGLAPRDPSGMSYELHHVGQKADGTLSILTGKEHDNPVLHGFLERSEAHAPGNNWDAERQAFWKALAALYA